MIAKDLSAPHSCIHEAGKEETHQMKWFEESGELKDVDYVQVAYETTVGSVETARTRLSLVDLVLRSRDAC